MTFLAVPTQRCPPGYLPKQLLDDGGLFGWTPSGKPCLIAASAQAERTYEPLFMLLPDLLGKLA